MKCSFEKENISSNQEEMESQYMICNSCEWFYNCDVAFTRIISRGINICMTKYFLNGRNIYT